ncbi:hypothetical protein PHYSODRAFT_320230 [Phytophthora sojae]|uniref:Urease accessory protein UreH-like transmembrane domain-containing protein n=1 Tax=Phytophthora sojae (strain P6497) TaxID=1094619 RepID=G5AHN4_PHYSP|nr:hypothetical protein PHYSODRAFT_320230 [Phytophthora sojae]EGZ04955.1 hypothetical protein PHYSODRAFT_320230 [Phytophthora sojae]|eukprot:XP_009539585.1 hypothetical protein PHYSODRAFT_320230 [Phytophthora sojae]
MVSLGAGPDHLSAQAAMTTGSSWRAFALGIRWGCGHSIGLVVIALIFFAAGQTVDLDAVGGYLNYAVGFFMTALGIWAAVHVRENMSFENPATQKVGLVALRTRCGSVGKRSHHSLHIMALLVGIIHGFAGPGGILGVLPAVVLNDWAVAYPGSFCVASIFIMGVFAALYGEVTGRLGGNSLVMEFRIGIFSAFLSFIVGVAWIGLQASGQMDAVLGE